MEYAGFWRRFGAYIIDFIILGVITAPFHIGGIVDLVYIIGFWTWRGQTPGKMALGVQIIRTDGSPIGFGTAILRYIGYIVSAIILLIGYFMIAWDSKKQGLHDKIAGTYVVRTQ